MYNAYLKGKINHSKYASLIILQEEREKNKRWYIRSYISINITNITRNLLSNMHNPQVLKSPPRSYILKPYYPFSSSYLQIPPSPPPHFLSSPIPELFEGNNTSGHRFISLWHVKIFKVQGSYFYLLVEWNASRRKACRKLGAVLKKMELTVATWIQTTFMLPLKTVKKAP